MKKNDVLRMLATGFVALFAVMLLNMSPAYARVAPPPGGGGGNNNPVVRHFQQEPSGTIKSPCCYTVLANLGWKTQVTGNRVILTEISPFAAVYNASSENFTLRSWVEIFNADGTLDDTKYFSNDTDCLHSPNDRVLCDSGRNITVIASPVGSGHIQLKYHVLISYYDTGSASNRAVFGATYVHNAL
jgi:hypothetical protein